MTITNDHLYAWLYPYYWSTRQHHADWLDRTPDEQWILLTKTVYWAASNPHLELMREMRTVADRYLAALAALERSWIALH